MLIVSPQNSEKERNQTRHNILILIVRQKLT